VIGVAAVGLSFRTVDDTWKRQLLFGLPITLALVGLAALLVDGIALIPYQFPNSYYLWVGLVVFAFAICGIGWRRFRNWRRAVSALSVLLTTVMAFTLINQHYQYYPTLGSILGVNAQHQVTPAELIQARANQAKQPKGSLPAHGVTVAVHIPATASGFKARDAYIWVPPIWIADVTIKLPVIELIAGVPSSPSDWTRGGFADQTASTFAAAHHGIAPLIVMPDANGSSTADTECVNSPRGQAETYLTVDVPNYMRANFNAETTPDSMAIAGLSAGATCSVVLALRHPQLYTAFGDYSGLTSPTVGNTVEPEQTTKVLFGGSTSAYDAHDPLWIMAHTTFPKLSGWFEVGTQDSGPLAAQRTLIPLAQSAQIATCAAEIPGDGHSFDLWSKAFADSLPWMSHLLGLTPAAATEPATCQPS
jgi:S-formylglutathione hydrolase FrmB